MSKKFGILKLTDLYLSKQRSISGNNSEELTEKIMLNIDEKFREMLKTSFEILSFSLNRIGKFPKKENKIFTTLESKILKMIKPMTNKTDIEFDNIVAFALTLLNFGIIYMKIEENIEKNTDTLLDSMKIENKMEQNTCSLYTNAKKFFLACLGVLEGKELDSKAILIVMKAYNKISFILFEQQKLEENKDFLFCALNTYVKYTKNEYSTPIDIAITLGIGEDAKELDTKMVLDEFYLEILQTLLIDNIFNPDNMYDMDEFVNCMHNLLNNLIKEESIHQYYKDWAMTAADLSLYFIHHNRFTEARHYIAAAYCMLKKANVETLTKMTETTISNRDSNFLSNTLCTEYPYEYAKIAKLCGQYGIQLFHASKEKLLPSKENQSCQVDNLECSNSTKSEEKLAQCLIFTDLEEELKDEISFIQISDKYLSNLSDITIVFQKLVNWFEIAMEFFTMEKHVIIYGEIFLYISLAFKYFADFVQDKDRQMRIYKKQIEILLDIVKKLPRETSLNNIKRLMWLELGISHSALLDILGDGTTISDVKTDQELLLKLKSTMRNCMNCFKFYLYPDES
ncbi:KIF-binding protein-like [Linepithema humile]|uniref:KIF-binding protein-like n=1 Tax=Linepithema humile TaxID=83485 RepID=UPI00351EAE1C